MRLQLVEYKHIFAPFLHCFLFRLSVCSTALRFEPVYTDLVVVALIYSVTHVDNRVESWIVSIILKRYYYYSNIFRPKKKKKKILQL